MAKSASKMRVHELAKSHGLSTAELRDKVAELGFDWDVSNAMKSVSAEQVAEFEAAMKPKKAPAKKAPAKKAAAEKAPAKKAAAEKAPAKKAAAEPGPPMRVHELAKARGVGSKELREQIVALGFDWDVSNHMKTLTGEQILEFEAKVGDAGPDKKSKAPAKKASAKGAKKTAGDEAAKKADRKAGDEPKKARGKKDDADDDSRGRRRGRRDDDARDPEGFDPVPAAVRYLTDILKGLEVRARVTGKYDGKRLQLDIAGPNAEQIIGNRNASADPSLVDGLQILAGRAAFGDRSSFKNTYIDVAGFRQGRVDQLKVAAKRVAKFVADTGRTVHLPAMNNFDRYAFHTTVGRVRGVESESEGNGVFRMLSIKPRDAGNDRGKPKEAPVEAAGSEESDGGDEKRSRRRRRPSKDEATE